MGALIARAILLFRHAERFGLEASIISTNPLYGEVPGEDWLDSYFFTPGHTTQGFPLRGVSLDAAMRFVVHPHLNLTDAARLFHLHFRPRPVISVPLQEVLSKTAGGLFDLSIHYRGTDKVIESGTVGFESMVQRIDAVMALSRSPRTVFLATDDPQFEQTIRTRYPRCEFASFKLGSVPEGKPRHFSSMSPRAKAIEAIVNIFLIASAKMCIRTSSYLSAVSRIANPTLRTFTVNRTLAGSRLFPEMELLAAEESLQFAPG
ncbi:MAG TPA: hypothetical protein VMT03_24460 [Polyangia bacterium]|nr:hypothetical protein [Polyangia bacterium]